jgi:CheY-like chemotaxis protein
MMRSESTQKTILWIENDKQLTEILGRLLEEHLGKEFPVDYARHKDEALQKLKARPNPYFALIVDIMLPKTAAGMEAAEELETKRGELLDQLDGVNRDPSSKEYTKQMQRKALKNEIDEIDRHLDELTDLGGGIDLLEKTRGDGPALQTLTIILSARTLPGLKERARNLVEAGKFYWIEKPASVETIVAILKRHCEG